MKKTVPLLFLIFFMMGCNGSQTPSDGQAYGIPDEDGIRIMLKPNGVFSMDDLVKAGFKKSKQFDTSTVPGATEVWYGFFNKKDIEVRIYESHETAIDLGKEPAEIVLGKKPGQTDYLIPVVNRYPAYAIVGNVVMLCERELKTCTDLVDTLP